MYAKIWLKWVAKCGSSFAIVAFIAVVATLACAPNTARAGLTNVLCTGGGSISWNPGVTNTPATITQSLSFSLTTCVNMVNGNPVSLGSGQSNPTIIGELSCSALFTAYPLTTLTVN